MENNLVITILAAGEGKRMNSSLPKVLHLFHGKPMLIRIINTALTLCPEKIIIVTGKYDKLIRETVSEYINTRTHRIEFVLQENPQGTGDAIKQCLRHYLPGEKILILNGDMPLITKNILETFIDQSEDACILVAKFENPFGYGRIVYDSAGDFIKIVEEKDCSEVERQIQIVNSGLYLINSDILHAFIPLIDNNNTQKEYYLTDIVKLIKMDSRFNINTYLIDEMDNKNISGVNTQDELKNLL